MSGYYHRVHTREVPTAVVPPRRISASIPVVVGTAPVHMLGEGQHKPVNEQILCCNFKEFVEQLGFTDEADANGMYKYTLCEFADVFFGKYAVAPIVFINVFDPAKHKTEENPDVTKVTSTDIVGGYDADAGTYTGLELVNQVFPKFRVVPGQILAPGFSHDPAVSVVMDTKAGALSGLFKCVALSDIPDATCTKYTDVPSWKEQNNYTGKNTICCWPKVKLGERVYNQSTHIAGLIAQTDADYEGIPYVSPSNRRMMIDGAVANGKPVHLELPQAEYLNGQGVVTALNFDGGWKAFGNRTACYPSNTDPKDAFIPVRRFFNWHSNTFVLTYFQKLDGPVSRRLIETIVDSENIRLNGFKQMEIILGGEIFFFKEENPTTDLIDGRVRFRTKMTPPVPARELINILEFDVNNFQNLFGGN